MPLTSPDKKSGWLPLVFLLPIWLIVQGILLNQYGIVTKGESVKYINEAVFWQEHYQFSQPKYIFYSVYIFIRLLALQTGAGIEGVYIFQLLINLYATFLFYKLSIRLFTRPVIAVTATTLLLICFPWQLWTTHLYTESVFISLAIIFTYFFFLPEKSKFLRIITIILFILLLFCRPTGMLFIPVITLWYFIKWWREKKWLLLGVSSLVSLVGFILILNYAMKGEGEFNFLKPFIEEHIICGVPQAANDNLKLPSDGNSTGGLLYYIVNNPTHFFSLSLKKIGAFFGMTRSYFSTSHNLYLRLFFYPLYLLALAGVIIRGKMIRDFKVYACGIVIVFAISVALTCDDWLNRFIMPVLPYIILLATAGIIKIMSYKKSGISEATT